MKRDYVDENNTSQRYDKTYFVLSSGFLQNGVEVHRVGNGKSYYIEQRVDF